MAHGLLGRLEANITFVVGKGGVGKTTTAGGLALALADRGTHTHLVSVDPAHSLNDLFQDDPEGDLRASPCTERLVLEELDAHRFMEDRLGALAPGLRELIDRGTYLDLEDADSLLGASMPGLDEIGAALRIVELSDHRVVVDTAPTGHLLRLLHAPTVVRSWIEVFNAMAEKADAVASALVGRRTALSAEADLRSLGEEAGKFEELVSRADFVVVTAPGDLVAAETRRLVGTLQDKGLRVAATASVRGGEESAGANVLLPSRRGLAGCEALRSWWSELETAASEMVSRGSPSGEAVSGGGVSAAASRPAMGPPPDSVGRAQSGAPLPMELDRELVVFAGKGGVGKTTCAAAVAVRLAEQSPVLLMGVDPAGSLADVLDGGEMEGLEVRELDGERELDRLKSRYRDEVERAFARIGLDRAARLDRAVIESLWQLAPPGVDELMAVSRVAEEVEAGTRLVLDPAPTGHFLRLVSMPELAMDWLRRIMHILMKFGAVADLEALAAQLLQFARRFRTLRDLLMDGERTAIIVVTLEEPMVQPETERLIERVKSLGMPVSGRVVNRAAHGRPAEAGGPGLPTWRVPEMEEPKGIPALREFTGAWERVT